MAEESEGKKAGGGMGGFIVALLGLAVLGAGAGAGFSMTFLNSGAGGDHAAEHAAHAGSGKPDAAAKPAKASKAGGTTGPEVPKEQVVGLEPILVTLAGPQKAWARLELGIVVVNDPESKEDRTPLFKSVTEDMMSFLRTVPLNHVESAAGLEYLREDLSEIAQKRSKGRVRGVVLRSLVVE